jgi:hypothetical protein
MGVLDKIKKFKNSRPRNDGGRSKIMGLWHDFQDGSNELRLVSGGSHEFLEVRSHFICPAPKRGERGLCQAEAFNGDDKIPKVVNCPDWDIEMEEERSKKTCPVCRLFRLAKEALVELKKEDDPDKKDVDYFEKIVELARPRTSLKWNVFDREKPNVIVVDENGNEKKQKGLKIASFGMEAWNDIEGIFEQCGFDISDPVEGVDINVIKGHNGARIAYSAQVKLEGTSVKVTPFDEDEREIASKPHDLLAICGKQTDSKAIQDALHGDYAELLELNDDDDENSYHLDYSSPSSDGYDDDDDDALLGGTEKKK